MLRCPRCRHRPLGLVRAIAMPNTLRERIVCRVCGEVLDRQPMRSCGEAVIVWLAIMLPVAPLVAIGGSLGFGLTLALVLGLLWVAPWQGLSYALPPGSDCEPLPVARLSVGRLSTNGGDNPSTRES